MITRRGTATAAALLVMSLLAGCSGDDGADAAPRASDRAAPTTGVTGPTVELRPVLDSPREGGSGCVDPQRDIAASEPTVLCMPDGTTRSVGPALVTTPDIARVDLVDRAGVGQGHVALTYDLVGKGAVAQLIAEFGRGSSAARPVVVVLDGRVHGTVSVSDGDLNEDRVEIVFPDGASARRYVNGWPAPVREGIGAGGGDPARACAVATRKLGRGFRLEWGTVADRDGGRSGAEVERVIARTWPDADGYDAFFLCHYAPTSKAYAKCVEPDPFTSKERVYPGWRLWITDGRTRAVEAPYPGDVSCRRSTQGSERVE